MNHLFLFVFCLLVQTLFYNMKGNEEDISFFFTSALQCIESLQRNEPNNFRQERLYRVLDDHTRTYIQEQMILGIRTSVTYWDHCTGVFTICFMNTRPDRGLLMQIYCYLQQPSLVTPAVPDTPYTIIKNKPKKNIKTY